MLLHLRELLQLELEQGSYEDECRNVLAGLFRVGLFRGNEVFDCRDLSLEGGRVEYKVAFHMGYSFFQRWLQEEPERFLQASPSLISPRENKAGPRPADPQLSEQLSCVDRCSELCERHGCQRPLLGKAAKPRT